VGAEGGVQGFGDAFGLLRGEFGVHGDGEVVLEQVR